MSVEAIRPTGAPDPEFVKDHFAELLGHHDSNGWSWSAGDPELHANKDRLIKPGGKVLDLGIGYGGSSMLFALHGMSVVGLDISEENARQINELAKAFNLPIEAKAANIVEDDLGENEYDIVLMADIFHHFPNKEAAFKVIEKGIKALKPGGYLWLKAPGKQDSVYHRLVESPSSLGAWHVEDDVFMGPCACSGELKNEHLLFFEQLELPVFIVANGLEIVESRVIPQKYIKNRMFGEDWPSERTSYLNGEVSALAQKPQGS